MSTSVSNDVKFQIQQQMQEVNTTEDGFTAKRPNVFYRAGRIEVASFIREFSILAGAEYPVLRALRLISTKTTNKDLSNTIKTLADKVESGTPLSESMAMFPWYFDGVAVNIVHASENSGRLEEGLTYLAEMLDHDQDVSDRVVQASLYPIVLGALALSVITMLLFSVVPTFAEYITEAGGKIEGMAAVVFAISDALRFPLTIPAIFLGFIAGGYGLYSWRQRDEIGFDTFVGRIPIIGRVMTLAALTRFVNMLHMLVANGVGLLQSLELAKGSLGNAYLRNVINDMHASVEQGKPIAEPLEKYDRVPNVFRDMIAIGEESGQLPQSLKYLSNVMRGEVNRTTDRLTVILQPLMLIFMGTIILGVFVSFFFPYFETLTSLSGIK